MPVVKVSIESFVPQDETYTDCALNVTGADVVFEYVWGGKRYTYRATSFPMHRANTS